MDSIIGHKSRRNADLIGGLRLDDATEIRDVCSNKCRGEEAVLVRSKMVVRISGWL